MFFLGPLKAQSKYSVLMPHQILKVQSALTLTLSLCFSVTGNSNQSLHLLFYANLSQHPLDLISFEYSYQRHTKSSSSYVAVFAISSKS